MQIKLSYRNINPTESMKRLKKEQIAENIK